MTINPILKIIRAKKLGVLIQDARISSGKRPEECANAMGIPVDDFKAMEFGERPPTLPELELFAYYLGIPLEHFWGSTVLAPENDLAFDPGDIKKQRQAEIGGLIQNARMAANLSVDELGEAGGIESAKLSSYESGETSISLPDLEAISMVLKNSIGAFEDQHGPAGSWFSEQKNVRQFTELPVDLQEFISKPINRPYLELAVRLSELKVERLRALAEGLLEITL